MFRKSSREICHSCLRSQPTLSKPNLSGHVFMRNHIRMQLLGQRRPASYRRFNANTTNAKWLLQRWTRPMTFLLDASGVAIIVGGFYAYHLENVPESGRRRFNMTSSEREEQLANQEYARMMAQYRDHILPEWDQRTIQVQRVLDSLIPHSGLAYKRWKVHVVASEMANACVLPSGQIFVFSGILPICRDDEGLAAVLGHEMAHNVAHHLGEKLSQLNILMFLAWILEWSVGLPDVMSLTILNLAFQRPGSRKMESEADYIGLMMMARSCFNPESAVEFWSRMEEYERQGVVLPQLISTHPSHHNRRAQMQQWLPEAIDKMNASECGELSGNMDGFRVAIQRS